MNKYWSKFVGYNKSGDLEKLLWITVPILILSVSFFILGINLSDKKISLVNAIVLFATFLAIIIYTWKTWQLKDLTAKQITYSIRPLVIFECRNHIFKNIGNGAALDIRVDNIPLVNCGPRETFEKDKDAAFIVFNGVGCLENKKEYIGAKLKFFDKNGKETSGKAFISNAISEGANSMTEFEMCIRYKDIDGNAYLTRMAIKDGVFQVVGIEE